MKKNKETMEKEKINCKHCGSYNVVKKGARKLLNNNSNKSRQIYFCKNCLRRFSLGLNKKRFNVWIIIKAVCAYNSGYSYEEVCELISRKYKIKIGKSSVERWVKEYSLGYLDIREKIIRKYGKDLIIERMFNHLGLIYNFKLHKGKLKEYGKFAGLRDFIFDVCRGINNKIFNGDGERCSKCKENVSVNVVSSENTRLNKVAGEMLKIVKNNKQRHSLVENLMLYCDRDTIAVEIPVWYWDKKIGKGICGHIDVLQVKFGKIWILDYKPDAEKENFEKVVSQLYNYALALYFRTGIRLENMKCGWFDSCKTYYFEPVEVKMR